MALSSNHVSGATAQTILAESSPDGVGHHPNPKQGRGPGSENVVIQSSHLPQSLPGKVRLSNGRGSHTAFPIWSCAWHHSALIRCLLLMT